MAAPAECRCAIVSSKDASSYSMVGQRTLKNSIRATGVGLHTGKKVLMTLRPAAAGHRHRVPPHRPAAAGGHPRARRERRRHACSAPRSCKGEARVSTVEHLLSAFAGLGHRQRHRRAVARRKCRSWTAAPARSCSCCSRPASRSSATPKRFIRVKKRVRVRGRRQVGAVRSVRRLQGQLRDRVQPPDLQAPRADARRWISPPPPSSRK